MSAAPIDNNTLELAEPLTPPAEPAAAIARADPAAASADDDDDDEADAEASTYSVEHLSAVLRPVMITMLLASLAVANIRDSTQDAALQSGLNTYLVYAPTASSGSSPSSSSTSSATQVGEAAINALVIVSVICAATFVLVLCYYMRCLRLMGLYLMFACVSLLGYSGGYMAVAAIERFELTIDWPTLLFLLYNFAIVGVVAVFWQKGIPRALTQWYLIAVSVIMAWLLTKLPEWTSWALLVALALYDLCAVLTPCGPLRALVNLAQERRDPIPGLLYEADVGARSGSGARGAVTRDTFVTGQPRQLPREASEALVVADGTLNSSARPEAALSMPKVPDWPSSSSAPPPPPAVVSVSSPLAALRQDHTLGDASADAAAEEAGDAEGEEDAEGDEERERGIKLGLGDFVFYSVLVSRAALYDASTAAACFVAVMMGLGGTLFLLGVFRKALPALPISIFLGVSVYFCTRYAVTPMIAHVVIA